MNRRIAVITSTRADYGVLQNLMRLLQSMPDVDLKVIATGTHLSPKFGSTWKVIAADGFAIDEKVDLAITDDSPQGAATSVARAIEGFARVLPRLAPDIAVVLGDRFEIMGAGVAATLLNVPMAHLHGGEVTLGAFDEAFRHSLTKMALLHFVAAEPYRQRVIQMGEDPARVFNVGSPGLDQLNASTLLARDELIRQLDIAPDKGFVLVTLHPVTTRPEINAPMVQVLLAALDRTGDRSIIFTGVNADPGHDAIDDAIKAYVSSHSPRARLFTSLGTPRYLSAMQYADAVIGNSSSGIIEAPALGVPTVNIGERQQGRLRAASIIDCAADPDAIRAALIEALSDNFRRWAKTMEPPYGRGGASIKIAEILRSIDLRGMIPKNFYDLPGR